MGGGGADRETQTMKTKEKEGEENEKRKVGTSCDGLEWKKPIEEKMSSIRN
jgi:hypothetical protein